MKTQKYSLSQYLKFIVPSFFGVLLFLIPMKVDGKFTLGVAVFCEIVQAWMAPITDITTLIFFVIALVVPIITMIFKPKFILNTEALNNVFNIKPYMLAIRAIGLFYLVAIQNKLGPEWLYGEATGGSAYFIVTTILTLMIVTSFFVSFLMDFGIMDFIGVTVRKLMRPLFTVPGRSSLDCIASWFGSSLTGSILTSIQYKEGYYSSRESCVIITCFSTAGFNFIFVLAKVCALDHLFIQSFLTIYTAVIICAIILPRIPPLSRKADYYYEGQQSQLAEDIPSGVTTFDFAMENAIAKADKMTLPLFVEKGFKTIMSVWFDVLPMVMFIATTGMILAECTPIFSILSKPFVPLLNMMGYAEAELAAPMLLTGFLDQFLPIAMAGSITSISTRFFVFCVAIAQVIYMSEIGVILLTSKMKINCLDILLIFLQRTIISMPIIWLMAKFVFRI